MGLFGFLSFRTPFILFICFALLLPGCRNLLSEAADKTTTEAVMFEAQKLMNERRWDEAITALETLPASELEVHKVIILRASAYAGRCGLDFISFVEELKDMDGSQSILQIFLKMMKDTESYADCKTAEDLIESAGATGADRTVNENLLMTLVSFSKIGAVLAATGNADEDDDGVADAGFNACTSLTRADGAEIGTGLAIAIDSLSASDIDLFGDAMDDIEAFCTTLGACETNPDNYNDTERDAIRTLVHDDDGSFGLGTQDPGTDPTKICLSEGS